MFWHGALEMIIPCMFGCYYECSVLCGVHLHARIVYQHTSLPYDTAQYAAVRRLIVVVCGKLLHLSIWFCLYQKLLPPPFLGRTQESICLCNSFGCTSLELRINSSTITLLFLSRQDFLMQMPKLDSEIWRSTLALGTELDHCCVPFDKMLNQ